MIPSIADQLAGLKSTPLFEPTAPQSAQRQAAIRKAHVAHTARAVARYRAAMQGKGWLPTGAITQALGYGDTVANCFLRKLVEEEIIERRPRNDAPKFNRKQGWEYRWK